MENIILSAVHMLSNKTFKTTLSLIQMKQIHLAMSQKRPGKGCFVFSSLLESY